MAEELHKALGGTFVVENRAGAVGLIGTEFVAKSPPDGYTLVVSSGAIKAENTGKIIKALKSLNYVVNTVTPEKEGVLALRSVLPPSYASSASSAAMRSAVCR